jgi:hypothetical protein
LRLLDFLTDVGRPIAYYPKLSKALGGSKQTILLCQLIYWCDKGSNPDGWIYKSVDELIEETGLTYKEQIGARAALRELGLIEDRYARLKHRLEFFVHREAINDFWDKYTASAKMSDGHLTKSNLAISQDVKCASAKKSDRYTKSTTVNTDKEDLLLPPPPPPACARAYTYTREDDAYTGENFANDRDLVDHDDVSQQDEDFQALQEVTGQIWGMCSPTLSSQLVTVICELRKKIEPPATPENIRWFGEEWRRLGRTKPWPGQLFAHWENILDPPQKPEPEADLMDFYGLT